MGARQGRGARAAVGRVQGGQGEGARAARAAKRRGAPRRSCEDRSHARRRMRHLCTGTFGKPLPQGGQRRGRSAEGWFRTPVHPRRTGVACVTWGLIHTSLLMSDLPPTPLIGFFSLWSPRASFSL